MNRTEYERMMKEHPERMPDREYVSETQWLMEIPTDSMEGPLSILDDRIPLRGDVRLYLYLELEQDTLYTSNEPITTKTIEELFRIHNND